MATLVFGIPMRQDDQGWDPVQLLTDVMCELGSAKSTSGVLVTVDDPTIADGLAQMLGKSGREFFVFYPAIMEGIEERLEQVAMEPPAPIKPEDFIPPTSWVVQAPVIDISPVVNAAQSFQEAVGLIPEHSNGKGGLEKVCEHCGEVFHPRRKDMKFCEKPACQKAKKTSYQKTWHRKEEPQATLPAEAQDQPTNEDLQEAAEFEETLAVEMAADGLVDDGLAVEETPIATTGGGPWLVEDGSRKGTRLTPTQLCGLLMQGNMKVGQHVSHPTLGQCRVIKGKFPGQNLERLYGEGAPATILPGELL